MFHVVENGLDIKSYSILRKKVGFADYANKDIQVALSYSLYSVVVYDDMSPIGIARLVGDNKVCFFLKDVVVDPRYRKLYIGELMMKHLLNYISRNACEGAYIGLMSTPTCIAFYEKYGFKQRPCDDMGPGMIKFYSREDGVE